MRITALAHQLFALGHAELVLLVNDDQAESGNSKFSVSRAWVPMNKVEG